MLAIPRPAVPPSPSACRQRRLTPPRASLRITGPAHEAVQLAMVIGVLDDYRGEAVKACVVVKDTYRGRITEAELATFCKSRLTTYKVPPRSSSATVCPQAPTCKLLRRALRDE